MWLRGSHYPFSWSGEWLLRCCPQRSGSRSWFSNVCVQVTWGSHWNKGAWAIPPECPVKQVFISDKSQSPGAATTASAGATFWEPLDRRVAPTWGLYGGIGRNWRPAPGQEGNVLPADREQAVHHLWPVLLALYLFLSLFANNNIGPVGWGNQSCLKSSEETVLLK